MKRVYAWPGTVFAIVVAWKALLLVFFALPVPSNDAFFYDGPVVNYLLHGKYCNPSLAQALPISGSEVFSAYPPLYQVALLQWMRLAGTSALSAMTFHCVLFGAYVLVLYRVFRRLDLPAWACHIGALFLLGITFHDRPDSLGHVFGILAAYAMVRFITAEASGASGVAGQGWVWWMVVSVILSLATGLQIGGVYFLMAWSGVVLARLMLKRPFPIPSMVASIIVPAGLVLLVMKGFPHLWAGFLEHARQTPSLTGFRIPGVSELLKMSRTVPGILVAVALLLPMLLRLDVLRLRWPFLSVSGMGWARVQMLVVTLAALLPSLAITVASMFLLTPNGVFFAAYLQPLAVAGLLVWVAGKEPEGQTESGPGTGFGNMPWLKGFAWLFVVLAAVGSVRAVGLSTWGALCSADVDYPNAVERVAAELEGCPPGSNVVLSSAFLYEALRHDNVRSLHSDWLMPAERGKAARDLEGLLTLKPVRIVLTQFDYYRRYLPVLESARTNPAVAQLTIFNTARTPAPDSIPSLQKVVQHISWAPVVVSITWGR